MDDTKYKCVELESGDQILYPVSGYFDINVPDQDEMIDMLTAISVGAEIVEMVKTPLSQCKGMKYWDNEKEEWFDIYPVDTPPVD